MKIYSFLLIGFFSLTSHYYLFGQRVRLSANVSGVNTVLDSGERLNIDGSIGQVLYPSPPPPPPRPGAYYEPPAYSTFWIYPDGHFETIDFGAGRTDFINGNARIVEESKSNIHCFLTEKYINTDPPDDAVALGKSTITDPPILAYRDDIHGLDLFVNNAPRPGYKMVTAMSYDKNLEANNLFLFYNNVVGKESKPYPLFESPVIETILPDYSKREVSSNAMTLPFSPNYFSGLEKYNDAIHFELKAVGSNDPPFGFGRKRIFSVLNTKKNEDTKYPFGEYANILGILTSGKGGNLTRDEADLARSFGFNVDNYGQCQLDSGLYIIGIDTLQREIVPTHDPNHLTLKKACKEGDFLILDYELTICNESIQPETQIDIEISGLNGYIVNDIEFTSPSPRPPPDPPIVPPTGTFIYYPSMILAAANHRFPSCDVVSFTVKIPHGGDLYRATEMLIKNRPFINYCVKFNSTLAKINECDSKYSFIKIDTSYRIPICEPVPTPLHLPFPWWKYLLIVIIIIPVVWYFFRRKGPKV